MYYEKPNNDIKYDRNQLEMICLDQMVPDDHLVRKIENAVDFEFIHRITKQYYCQDNGRNCLDTIILFKIILINFLFGIGSVRKTIEEIKVNNAYRWFLGIGLSQKVPHYSVFSQNYRRRYADTNVFDEIFNKILMKLYDLNLLDTSVIFVDGTHVKANANKRKFMKKQVKVTVDKYHQELRDEVNEFRDTNGRDKFDDNDDDYCVNEDTGEITIKEDTKTITESTTDPDSGMYVKGEHERQFAYVDQVACDKNGWILATDVNPGNMHDSKAFLPFFEDKLLNFKPKIICADAGYKNNLIAKYILDENIKFLVPYAAPKGRKSNFTKKMFKYHLEINAYQCPNMQLLHLHNITKDGLLQYKISSKECCGCEYKKQCLKNYNHKTITRHLYEECGEFANAYRLTDEGKKIYKLRKETIERAFGEAKERHALRYTRFKGLKKNRHYTSLLFACLNIKKLANLLDRKAKNETKYSLT